MEKEEGNCRGRGMEGKEKKNYEPENTNSMMSPVKALAPSGGLTLILLPIGPAFMCRHMGC